MGWDRSRRRSRCQSWKCRFEVCSFVSVPQMPPVAFRGRSKIRWKHLTTRFVFDKWSVTTGDHHKKHWWFGPTIESHMKPIDHDRSGMIWIDCLYLDCFWGLGDGADRDTADPGEVDHDGGGGGAPIWTVWSSMNAMAAMRIIWQCHTATY